MEDITRIEAFKMWIWRRMEKLSWVERKTNEEVLIMVEEKRELLDRIAKTTKRWIGHIIRGNGLLKEGIEGRIDGRRPKGRKRIGMLSEFKEDGYASMKRGTDKRESWRSWMPRRTCQQTEHYIYTRTVHLTKYFYGLEVVWLCNYCLILVRAKWNATMKSATERR